MNTQKEKEKPFIYLENLLKFGIKLNLKNITTILKKLHNPQLKVPTIHIAGTNGKGSVSCMLNNALQNCQLKVGLFTSPYLVHFTERWRINGQAIAEKKLASLITKISQLELEITPTYFEILTAVAFFWFAEQKVDIAILETGMGGRLDATNVCNPLLTIITNISLDHTQYLGTTIKEIAQEKAGIIKKNIPLIIGKVNKDAQQVINEIAQPLNASIIDSKQYKITQQDNKFIKGIWQYQKIIIKDNQQKHTLKLPLAGKHQIENTKIVYATIEHLYQKNIINDKELAYQGIEKSYWAGRFDFISSTLIVDGAHNTKAVTNLANELKKNYSKQKWNIYFACMDDKDWQTHIDIFIPLANNWSLIQLQNPRAVKIDTLANYLKQQQQQYKISTIKSLSPNTLNFTLVVGSLYLVGEALKHLKGNEPLSITKQVSY